MSDRNTPNYPGQDHDKARTFAAETKRKSGPVRHLVKAGAPVAPPDHLEWSDMRDAVRKIASIQTSFLLEVANNGLPFSDDQRSLFNSLATIIKQMSVEERNSAPPTDADGNVSVDDLIKQANKAK